MALYRFTKAILNDETIDLYNHGELSRDFTYIDDVVHAIKLIIECAPKALSLSEINSYPSDSQSTVAPFRVINVGNSKPQKLISFISAIEKATGMIAKLNLMPMQAGDVEATWADTAFLEKLTGFKPQTDLSVGVAEFVNWYRKFHL